MSRDGHKCVRCGTPVTTDKGKRNSAHTDHIQPLSSGGTNAIDNLRTLCARCHVLRVDPKHRGMIAEALAKGIIDHNWRDEVWK